MKNVITALILILAMLASLSSCLIALNVAGENGTETNNNTEEKMTDNITTVLDSSGGHEIEIIESRNAEKTADEPETNTNTGGLPQIYVPEVINDITKIENGEIPEYPSEELISRITDDFFGDNLAENHFLAYYYGNYGGAVPVKFEQHIYLMACMEYYVAGYCFSDTYCYDYIRVWKDGKFYNLQEAYEYGVLTAEDIGNIWWLSVTNNYVHVKDCL